MPTSTETGRRRSQIFCRMREFTGSREARSWGLAGRHGPRPSTEIGGEVPITYAKGSDTSATRVSPLLPTALEAPSWHACRSLGGRSRLIRFRRGVCRDSRFWSLQLRSARPGANTEDKVRRSHVTPCHTGHTRPAQCVIAGSTSVKP
jgi:hypothetical protein